MTQYRSSDPTVLPGPASPAGHDHSPPATSGLAIAALICGILGFFLPLVNIAAVVLGMAALSSINTSSGRRSGRGLALAGTILGAIVAVVLQVVGIILLVGVLIAAVSGANQGTKIDTTKLQIREIEGALETYDMHMGQYPTTDQGPQALLAKPSFDDPKTADRWRGPYRKEPPIDPWGNAIHYEKVEGNTDETGGKPYKIWSNGPDGQDGTEDDIKNWSDTSSGSGSGGK